MTETVLLPDLLTLTGAAIPSAVIVMDVAKAKLRDELSENGKVSAVLLEQNQICLRLI